MIPKLKHVLWWEAINVAPSQRPPNIVHNKLTLLNPPKSDNCVSGRSKKKTLTDHLHKSLGLLHDYHLYNMIN